MPMLLPTERLRSAVLDWYRAAGRSLVFRRTRDPYAVLVLETMAQQTQIARAAEHWAAFLERFPSFRTLVDASPAEVIGAWRGLGYNRRALNLQRAARAVVERHGGVLPMDVDALQRLPGVGPYTARAVAATAFGVPVGAVDTNVRRVLARLFGLPSTERAALQARADSLVPAHDPAAWTHALMDLGSTICAARNPACSGCPLAAWCAYARDPKARDAPARPTPGAASKPPGTRRPRFPATSRWLRGRIIDRLRDAPPGSWITFDAELGEHSRETVSASLGSLTLEGLVELDPADSTRARLPTRA